MWPRALETGGTAKMLAIIEQLDERSAFHTDNTVKYLLLMLFKSGLDAAMFYLCCRKLHTSFLSICSASIVLADMLMSFSMAAVWFLGAERSLVSPCFLLACASATFGALPLPMMCLGLLDYCMEDTCTGKKRAVCKFLRNGVLALLVWTVAFVYSVGSAKNKASEMQYATGVKAMVCEVEESQLINYFNLGLFITLICTAVPFWSRIPQWVKEADELSEFREEQKNQGSDLFTSTPCTQAESSCGNKLEGASKAQPPLWFSLTLGFSIFWMPYLAVSVACFLLGFGVPPYITVNLLWFECTNSLLLGVVFWVQSKSLGPYSQLPENVCLWHVYWHLSKGTWQQQLPKAVFNPSKQKRISLFHV